MYFLSFFILFFLTPSTDALVLFFSTREVRRHGDANAGCKSLFVKLLISHICCQPNRINRRIPFPSFIHSFIHFCHPTTTNTMYSIRTSLVLLFFRNSHPSSRDASRNRICHVGDRINSNQRNHTFHWWQWVFRWVE